MKKEDKCFVAGHNGLLGSAIVRKLKEQGFNNLLLKTKSEVDLRNQGQTEQLFEQEKPDYVFMAAATVGGINANNIYRGEFIYNNIAIAANVIHAAHQNKTKKLLNIGSNCIYPKVAPNPIKEESLLTGALEQTNEPYAIAKIAAIKICEAYRVQYDCNFISAMPCNLFGIGDHYDLERCHVVPALIRRFHEAKIKKDKSVTLWGTGEARREVLFADDCADACIFLMKNYNEKEPINIGYGWDIPIQELAKVISEDIVKYKGETLYDATMPNGTMRKRLSVEKINKLGWQCKSNFTDRLITTYEDFKLRYK